MLHIGFIQFLFKKTDWLEDTENRKYVGDVLKSS